MALQDDKPGSAPKERSGRQIRSSAARLAAVQALYVLDLAEDARVDQVVLDFMSGSMGGMAIVEVADPEGIFDPTEEIAALEPPMASCSPCWCAAPMPNWPALTR